MATGDLLTPTDSVATDEADGRPSRLAAPKAKASAGFRRLVGERDGAALPIVDSVVSVGIAIAIGAALLQAAMHMFNFFVFDSKYTIVDAGFEQTIPNWAGSSATFAAAVGAALGAILPGRSRWRYGILAAILTYFAMDDSVGLHELIVHKHVHEVGTIHYAAQVAWPILYAPILIGGFVLLVLAAREAPWRARLPVFVGIACLVAAVAAELLVTIPLELGLSETTFWFNLEVVIEEGLELAGWLLIATGLLADALGRASAPTLGQA